MKYITSRTVKCCHSEAFQLMLYRSGDGHEIWIWNSRDGVTPFGTTVNMGEYSHAMNRYEPSYYGSLPAAAAYVWMSHSSESWTAMKTASYERFSHPHAPLRLDFLERFPNVADWLAACPLEVGSPRLLTRDEYLDAGIAA